MPEQQGAVPVGSGSRVILIGCEPGPMTGLKNALQAADYEPCLFETIDQALPYLSKSELLLIDSAVAKHPKSSKLIKVSTLLVMTHNQDDMLPPWLEARHVFLVPYPNQASDLVDRLRDYVSPSLTFSTIPTNPEHLAILFGINQALSGHFSDINDLFERVLNLAPYLRADFAALLIQEENETIYYRSTQPGREELSGSTGRRFAQRLLRDGLEGWVLRHNQAVILSNTLTDSRWFRASYLPDQQHCVVGLPVTLERVEAQGVYVLGHFRPGFFKQADLPLLEAATTQISTAIENAMLFKNQSERSIQLSLINEVSQAATSILNLDAMLRTVVQAIRRSFGFYQVSIHLFNPDSKLVELKALVTAKQPNLASSATQEHLTHRLRQGLVGWAMATNNTIVTNDVTRDPRYIFTNENREVRSELCVPIAMGTKTIGVLNLQSTELESFDKYHVSALETLGDQLAVAIENARLYDKINQHIEELQSLNRIGQAITSTLDLQKILKLITNQTIRLMNVAAASVALRDDATNEVWFAAASGQGSEVMPGLRMPLGQGLAGWVAEQGEAVIVPDVSNDSRFFADVDKSSGFTTQSILCVPLQTKGRTIGAIEVMNKRDEDFNAEDQALLQALANSAATAIENAQLYEKQSSTIKRLEETQYQLIQSAKLAAVGELAAGVAHEINNPLTTIVALTSLLTDTASASDDQELYEDLAMIHAESNRARDIVRNLLDFARADQPRRQLVDLNQLIEEAISLVIAQPMSQHITFDKSLSDLPKMMLDFNQMKQVFVNLLNNAVQAMIANDDRPALLSITTRQMQAKQVKAEPANGDGRLAPVVICTISDTGPGISPDDLDKIFDPFFTTKEVGQGTGLGLSISYGIIKKHGGEITVASHPSDGTTFTITLPV